MKIIYTLMLLTASLRADMVLVNLDPTKTLTIGDLSSPGGFEYTIHNGESTLWMELVSISNTTTLFGNFVYLSSFPILGPLGSLTEPYSSGVSGLAEYYFDPGTTPGTMEKGEFLFLANFYASDPTAGPVAVSGTGRVTAEYEVQYIPGGEVVIPEPRSWLLGALAILSVIGYSRRRKR